MKGLLSVTNLIASYGVIKGIKGVSLTVAKGELVTLVGANGAGKSTLLKSIVGMTTIDEGTVKFKGEDITGKKPSFIMSRGISIVPEGRRIFPDLTVLENLEVAAYTAGNRSKINELGKQVFDMFPRLWERKKQYGGTLSGGEQQMLAFGRALMATPELILMDEPSMGLAPVLVAEIFETITKIKETGTAILLVEQNAMMALKIAERAYLMRTGNIVGEYKAQEILRDPRLAELYLNKK